MTIRRRDPPQFVVSHVVAGAPYPTGTFNAGLYLAGAVIVSRAVIGAAGWPALRAVRTPARTHRREAIRSTTPMAVPFDRFRDTEYTRI
jgi:hypothetical protein